MDIVLFYCTFFLYALATLGYLAHLVWMSKPIGKASLAFLVIGFVLHTACIFARYQETGYIPVTNRFEALIFFSWLMVAVYLAVQLRQRLPVLGAFVTPPALLLLILASFDSKDILLPEELSQFLPSRWFFIHVWFAFLGDALMGLSASFAAMYLIQQQQLKSKKIGPFYYRLPALEALDRFSYRCISIGFPFLTLGILTGAVWLRTTKGIYIDWQDGRQTSTLLTWFLYSALLHGRLVAGWRRRRIAWMNVLCFVVILVTFLGLSHFME